MRVKFKTLVKCAIGLVMLVVAAEVCYVFKTSDLIALVAGGLVGLATYKWVRANA